MKTLEQLNTRIGERLDAFSYYKEGFPEADRKTTQARLLADVMVFINERDAVMKDRILDAMNLGDESTKRVAMTILSLMREDRPETKQST